MADMNVNGSIIPDNKDILHGQWRSKRAWKYWFSGLSPFQRDELRRDGAVDGSGNHRAPASDDDVRAPSYPWSAFGAKPEGKAAPADSAAKEAEGSNQPSAAPAASQPAAPANEQPPGQP